MYFVTKHRSKRKHMKKQREKVQSFFASKDLQAERVPEVIGRSGVFRDRDKLGRSRVCCAVESQILTGSSTNPKWASMPDQIYPA